MQELEIKQTNLDYRAKEAYKTLRTNIEFSGDNIKVIGITSTVPREGKSTTSFELAISFAQAGKRTLLIDADLRKSVMRSRYKRGRIRYGLTNYLVGRCDLMDAVAATDVEDFHMIFAGPMSPSPSELLGGERFRNMIDTCRELYDIIIIDTPPIGSVIDAAIISRYCDGMAVVMKSGEIHAPFARKIKEQLEMADVRILGVILNQVDMSGKGYYGKYYDKYYGKYYGNYGNYGEE